MAGLYIHIPFCKSRCIYCGFYSTTLGHLRAPYVDALCREMEMRAAEAARQSIGTIYLGGGTPSQLTESQLRQIFSHIYNIYKVEPNAEITIECNPDDIALAVPCSPTADSSSPADSPSPSSYAAILSRLPINRISMGAQTFDDSRLRLSHRRHAASQVAEAMSTLRAHGFHNISIDLMFGFPQQTLPQWADDIDQALALNPEHISAYSLTYEEGTPLQRLSQSDPRYAPISDELSLAMYHLLIDRLTAAGYEHYEISNFARPGFRSRHNSSYWQGIPYIGIGAAAHSYDIDTRSWNVSDVERYIQTISQGQLPVEQREVLTTSEKYDDMVMTALRTSQGLSLSDIARRFGTDYQHHLLSNAQPHIDRNLLIVDNGRLRITRDGLFLSDAIISDLMYV
ncbi:MAG: coproporphyrinogen III oxidase family protein [Prevotella sp.]|nr:coproporphyrinogen III oxidase family protein [Prevotella sp.]